MRRFALLALADVLACGKTGSILEPDALGIVVVRDARSLGAKGPMTEVDFEGLPSDGSSCSTGFDTPIDNPLTLEGVVFADPYCLQSGYCSEPTCSKGNRVTRVGPTPDCPEPPCGPSPA